ncbi:hypothetical protein COOONC_11090 [Cooperia oncophora]
MWKGKDLVFPVNLNKTRSSLIPVLIIHEDATVDADTLSAIRNELIRTEWWAHSIATVMAGAGLALAVIAALYALYKYLSSRGGKTDSVSPLPAYEPRELSNGKGSIM